MKIHHSKNLRTGRVTETERPYLITTITHHRRPFFNDWRIGRLLVAELRAATQQGYAESLAYVVMPDHLHWLMIPGTESLPDIIRRIKSRSAHAINPLLKTSETFWQKGYHDHAVRRDEDIPALARYVIANPLRAGLVESIGDYPLWDAVWL